MAPDRCPVCAKLPLDGPPVGNEAPLEYDLDHDQVEFKKYKGRCSLYRLVQDLHRIWLENGEGSSNRYSSTCGPPNYRLSTDPGVWGVLPASSTAVVHPNPLDPSTIARLQTWIKICDQEHEDCHDESLPVLPTRVLDLGEPGFTGNVKLVETNGRHGQYIALSHCWGTSNSFLTTRDTIESRKNGFLPDQAPATFREAIMLARRLEIRYLWIDSLCIIQGDKEDWNIEASRMGDVYRNSYLMVAAANAASDTEGFFKPRPEIQCSMNVVAPTGQAATVYILPQGPNTRGIDTQPIDSRGWTLQETYLCRRQLRFMDKKIIWGCQSAQWDESKPDQLQEDQNGTGSSVTKLFPGNGSWPSIPYEKWYRMIEDFTRRDFTVQTDRLPALSGLAALVAAQKKGKYCAGLWWEDIGYSICWKTGHYSSLRPALYIAPSWSWASIIGSVNFPDAGFYLSRSESVAVQILDSVVFHDYQAIQRGSNPFGEIECAWLELEAPLARLFRPTDETIKKVDPSYGRQSEYYPRYQCQYLSILGNGELLKVDFDFEGEVVDDLCALFSIHASMQGDTPRKTYVILSGIILRPGLDPGKSQGQYNFPKALGLYQRVGFFQVVTHQTMDKFLEMVPVTKILLL